MKPLSSFTSRSHGGNFAIHGSAGRCAFALQFASCEMPRAILPQRRHAETFEVTFWNLNWRVTIGYFSDNVTPGEVFITGAKSGVDLESTARDGAILLSMALQHGVPLKTIKSALTRNSDGSPSTLIGLIADRLALEMEKRDAKHG